MLNCDGRLPRIQQRLSEALFHVCEFHFDVSVVRLCRARFLGLGKRLGKVPGGVIPPSDCPFGNAQRKQRLISRFRHRNLIGPIRLQPQSCISGALVEFHRLRGSAQVVKAITAIKIAHVAADLLIARSPLSTSSGLLLSASSRS